ncbi:MAG: glycosyltransferase family 39 protein, partial [Candidatus Sumerlaeia bacterium]|nr:glycosyltransferase family 39 protein [Candidatus Sumerlaeia bacterium]
QRKLPLYMSAVGIIFIIIMINFVYRQTHITDDELTYDLQAKILLRGKLYAPPPPVTRSFDNWFVITKGKYTGKYTIGHPLILAIGMLLESPYVLTVVFSGVLLLLVYKISWQLYRDKPLAILSSFLLLISPFYLFTSATRLSHSTSALFLCLFMYLFLVAINAQTLTKINLLFSLLAGLCLGYAFNVRPLTAIGFAIPFAIILAVKLIRQRFQILPLVLLMTLGFLILSGFTLWCNKKITGNWLEFPFHYYNPTERFGFGAMLRDNHYVHTPIKAVINLAISAARMNIFLLGMPLSLIFVFVLIFSRRLHSGDKLCLGIIGAFCFAYLFYYSPGVSDCGPVYYYELIIPLIILSARGMFIASKFISERIPELRDLVKNFVLVSVLLALGTFYPERILHILNLTDRIREPYEVVKNNDIHNAVIFIRSLPLAGWVFGYRNNSPEFNDDVLFCRLLEGEKNLEVVQHFPNRDYYILYYDDTEGGSKVIKVTKEELAQFRLAEQEESTKR